LAERRKHLNPIYQEILKQERLRNLVRIAKCIENSTVGIFETTIDDQIRAMSVSFCDLLGYSDEQLCQMSFQQICHPDDLAPYYFLKDRLLSEEIEQCYLNVRYLREDGQFVQVLQSTCLNLDANAEELNEELNLAQAEPQTCILFIVLKILLIGSRVLKTKKI
jgi:PAS domain S-box-containing protein